MRFPVAAVALAVVLAGCSSSGDDTGAGATPSATMSASATATSTGPAAPLVSAAAFAMAATGCRELLVLFTVTEAEARQFVPASYALLGGGGQAGGFLALKECSDVTVDGLSIGNASTSDAGIFVDKGEPGVLHYYQAWWTTDNPALWARLQAQGWYGGVSNDTLSAVDGTGVGEAAASVEYVRASYTLGAQIGAGSAPGDTHAVGWFDTPNGTVTADKTLRGSRLGTGRGTMTGSGDAQLLFGGLSSGTAVWSEYTMAGTVGPA